MSPFLDDEDDFDNYLIDRKQKLPPEDDKPKRTSFFHEDRRFFIIGGAASVVAFAAVAYIMYSNSKTVDIDELPVIAAETTPLKEKPSRNEEVNHQDKIVYDNVSGEKSTVEIAKTIPQPEEVLSINEVDVNASLSDEEKKNIIEAFDELAPDKEYKINYVKSSGRKSSTGNSGATSKNSMAKSDAIGKKHNISNGLVAVENVEKAERFGRAERSERSGRTEKFGKAERSERSGRAEKSGMAERFERSGRTEKSGKAERSERTGMAEKIWNLGKNDTITKKSSSTDYTTNVNNRNNYDDPPIKRLENDYSGGVDDGSRRKSSLSDLMDKATMSDTSPPKLGGNIMVQVASLNSRAGAEVEYKRLQQRNRMLASLNKKIVRVDLGRLKGIRYRVLVGPFKNNAEAGKLIQSMRNHGVNAYISR
ncbi:MAG: SPOR domain-containing protein [Holosporaceae bacterium]|jgi:hypothetical protein|nr:SPOR domain-containing protein [Holosporaceae bacterium]